MSKHKQRQQWYSMAGGNGSAAVLDIFDSIGWFGIDASSFARDLSALGEVDLITVRINSPGGSVTDGLAIYNLLKQHPARVEVEILGLAASIASIIALAGDVIKIPSNGFYMIHNPWTFTDGDADQLRKAADTLDKMKEGLLNTYEQNSTLSRDEIADLMDAETWFLGQEAVEAGFAQVLSDDVDLAALAGLEFSSFDKVPDQIAAAIRGTNPATPKPLAAAGDHSQMEQETMPQVNKQTTPAAGTNPAPATNPADALTAEQIAAQALAQDSERRAGIRDVFAKFGEHADLAAKCCDDTNCTVEQAREQLLVALGAQQKPHGGVIITNGSDEPRKLLMAHAENALMVRAGLAAAIEGNEVMSFSLMEMARAMLGKHGGSYALGDKMSIAMAALTHTSGDFKSVLGNVAHKAMLKGYEEADESFMKFCASGELPDFKVNSRVDIGSVGSLRLVREGAEYKSITIGDKGESAQLATYGEKFGITRQAIINDDLGAFTRIPRKMGGAAIRTVGDLVYALITNNVVMGDGTALYHADHKNLAAASALTSASVDELRSMMAKQKDGDAFTNMLMSYLLVPVEKLGQARSVLESEKEVGGSKTNTNANPVRGIATPIADARLTGNAFYGVADGNRYDAFEVMYLDGNSQPVLEEQPGWDVDGIEFKVRLDAAAKIWDYRTTAKNPGA